MTPDVLRKLEGRTLIVGAKRFTITHYNRKDHTLTTRNDASGCTLECCTTSTPVNEILQSVRDGITRFA